MTQAGALSGLSIEQRIIHKVSIVDSDALIWLPTMFGTEPIAALDVWKPPSNAKMDVGIEVITDNEEINKGMSVKSVKKKSGSCQLTRGWSASFGHRFGMEDLLIGSLKQFTGECFWTGTRQGLRRVRFNQQPKETVSKMIDFMSTHKLDILRWMFCGSEQIDYFMAVTNVGTANPNYHLYEMESVIQYYAQGDVVITRGGGIKLGRIPIQRKGGDKGAFSACQIQAKLPVHEIPELEILRNYRR